MSRRKATPGIDVRHRKTCLGARADGKCCTPSYQAHIYDARTGKRIRKTFPTKTAARLWRNDAMAALRSGDMTAERGPTLADAIPEWLDDLRAGHVRDRSGDPYKPASVRGYEKSLRLRVLPVLGHLRVTDVAPKDVQQLVDGLVRDGCSASTIVTTLTPLRAYYRRAVARGDVKTNPTLRIEKPAVRSKPRRFASPAEVAALLAALDPADGPLWATAFYAGLRRGELIGLRWEDVNLADSVIHVRRGWDAVEGEIAPKSQQGRRTVPVSTRR
jgi:integrase